LDHPNIVRLEEVYESQSEIYLVQELCLGGELFDRLDEQPDYHYTEAQCAKLVKQMLCAVRYLHSKGIIHRDLKVCFVALTLLFGWFESLDVVLDVTNSFTIFLNPFFGYCDN
jgi:serine/threonine protein kinase